jgi:hypothetical protein
MVGCGGFVGYLMGLNDGRSRGFLVGPQPQDLSSDELAMPSLVAQLPPMDIVVHLVTRDEIPLHCRSPGALACSYAYERPCEVWIPAMSVRYEPATEYAYWNEDGWHDTFVPHEFLHCIHPNWHDPWTKENQAKWSNEVGRP